MAQCAYCNATIPDDAKFCTNCGCAAIPVADTQPAQDAIYDTPLGQQPINPQPAGQQPGPEPPLTQQSYGQSYQQPGYQQPYQEPSYQQPGYQQPSYQQGQPAYNVPGQIPASADSGNVGWGILGFFFPLVGLILFLVWRTTKPKCAKVAGIGAIIGFCLNLLVYTLPMFMR